MRAGLPLWMSVALASGCAHGGVADAGPAVKLSLRPGPGLRVEGTVSGTPADVRLAVEEPRSLLSVHCLKATPAPEVQVRLPTLEGGWQTAPEIPLTGVKLGSTALPQFRAAVVPADGCVLWLGLDVLGRSVLDVDLEARTVVVTRDAPTLPASLEQVQVEVTRAPQTDRLLAAAQLRGSAATVLQTVIITTGRSTELGQFQARLLGAESVLRSAQLAPGWEACDVPVRTRSDWAAGAAIGALGPEGWGAARVLVDLAAGRMTLARRRDSPAPPCREAPDAGAATPGQAEREPR